MVYFSAPVLPEIVAAPGIAAFGTFSCYYVDSGEHSWNSGTESAQERS